MRSAVSPQRRLNGGRISSVWPWGMAIRKQRAKASEMGSARSIGEVMGPRVSGEDIVSVGKIVNRGEGRRSTGNF